MEVHHSHGASHKKKWTAYLLEFLMLFLAVFLGFIAENQREHMVEHQRARIYAANLSDELKKDTTRLNNLISRSLLVSGKLDTFCRLIKKTEPGNVTNGMLYYYASFVTFVSYFSPHNATIEQLKGSGNLRIMGEMTAQEISEYDKSIRELEKEYGLSKTEFEKMENLHFKLFDIYYMETLLPGSEKVSRDSIFQVHDLPVRLDPEMMKEYTGWLKFESNIYSYQVKEYLEPIRNKATVLLALLKKQFKVE